MTVCKLLLSLLMIMKVGVHLLGLIWFYFWVLEIRGLTHLYGFTGRAGKHRSVQIAAAAVRYKARSLRVRLLLDNPFYDSG